jgi:Bacterial Ig domain
MTFVAIISVLIGLGAAGLGLWDLHKVNEVRGQIDAVNGQITASIDNSVAATTLSSPTSGQTISGVVSLDAIPLNSHVKSVVFVANGGTKHNLLIGNGTAQIAGFGARWNSANVPNGTYQISSIGYNTVGRSARSPVVTVQVQNT